MAGKTGEPPLSTEGTPLSSSPPSEANQSNNSNTFSAMAAAADSTPAAAPAEKNRQLFIGDLPFVVDENMLLEHFSKVGEVEKLDLKRNKRDSSKPLLGYGFVTMMTHEGALAAKEKLDKKPFCGRALRVGWSHHGATPQTEEATNSSAAVGESSGGNSATANINSVYIHFSATKPHPPITEATLTEVFCQYGVVTDASIKSMTVDKTGIKTTGFGFVHFEQTPEGTEAAKKCTADFADRVHDEIRYKCELSNNFKKSTRQEDSENGALGSEVDQSSERAGGNNGIRRHRHSGGAAASAGAAAVAAGGNSNKARYPRGFPHAQNASGNAYNRYIPYSYDQQLPAPGTQQYIEDSMMYFAYDIHGQPFYSYYSQAPSTGNIPRYFPRQNVYRSQTFANERSQPQQYYLHPGQLDQYHGSNFASTTQAPPRGQVYAPPSASYPPKPPAVAAPRPHQPFSNNSISQHPFSNSNIGNHPMGESRGLASFGNPSSSGSKHSHVDKTDS